MPYDVATNMYYNNTVHNNMFWVDFSRALHCFKKNKIK